MADTAVAERGKKTATVGRPEEITLNAVNQWLSLLADGLSDDMAATCVRHSATGLRDYCNRYPTLSQRLGEAKVSKTLQHLKNLDRISAVDDVRGLNAAEKASEAMLRANDPRFRKDPDGSGGGAGGGVVIIVKSSSSKPGDEEFDGVGGVIDAEAVEVLEERRSGVVVEQTATITDLLDTMPQAELSEEAEAQAIMDGVASDDKAESAVTERENDESELF